MTASQSLSLSLSLSLALSLSLHLLLFLPLSAPLPLLITLPHHLLSSHWACFFTGNLRLKTAVTSEHNERHQAGQSSVVKRVRLSFLSSVLFYSLLCSALLSLSLFLALSHTHTHTHTHKLTLQAFQKIHPCSPSECT